MSAIEISRLFEKVKALEARVAELETKQPKPARLCTKCKVRRAQDPRCSECGYCCEGLCAPPGEMKLVISVDALFDETQIGNITTPLGKKCAQEGSSEGDYSRSVTSGSGAEPERSEADARIVERWKAGLCLFCPNGRPMDLNYCCAPCYKDRRDVAPEYVEEFIRLKRLCDAAVREGK